MAQKRQTQTVRQIENEMDVELAQIGFITAHEIEILIHRNT